MPHTQTTEMAETLLLSSSKSNFRLQGFNVRLFLHTLMNTVQSFRQVKSIVDKIAITF
jgi:hypothetical protein